MSNFLYSVEREYDVSLDHLWDAWINPEKLQIWYCPVDLSVVPNSVVSEEFVDGWWTVGVDVAAFNFVAYFYGKYSQIIKNQLLVHSLFYTQSEDEFKARDLTQISHEIRIEFETRENKSWVKFSQYGELPEGEAPKAQAGMESYFDNLQKFFDK